MTEADALLLSVAVEAPAAALLIWLTRWGPAWRAASAATLATLGTHWLAWRSILWLMPWSDYAATVLLVEAGVVAMEAIAYRLIVPLGLRRALVMSLAANAASTVIGLMLYGLDFA